MAGSNSGHQLNFNTILITVLLALASWNLKETIEQSQQAAKIEERTQALQREMLDLRARVVSVEAQVIDAQLVLARINVSP